MNIKQYYVANSAVAYDDTVGVGKEEQETNKYIVKIKNPVLMF